MEDITDTFIKDTVSKGKKYTLLIYRKGVKYDSIETNTDKLQMEHLHHLFTLRQKGLLILNGPVTEQSDIRGIGIFNMTDKEEVGKLVKEDPAVKAGRLNFELYSWFGLPGDKLP